MKQRTPFRRSILAVGLTAGSASCISMIGGIGLEVVAERLLPLVPLIIAMPALNTMAGDYAAIVAAHTGNRHEGVQSRRKLASAVFRAIWVNILGVLLLSIILANQRGYLLTGSFLTRFGLFVVGSMLAVIVMMFVISISLDVLLKKHRLNSDDVLIPVVTSISDVLMLGIIAAAAATIFAP